MTCLEKVGLNQAHFAMSTPIYAKGTYLDSSSIIYLQLVLFLRRLAKRTLDALIFVHFSLW